MADDNRWGRDSDRDRFGGRSQGRDWDRDRGYSSFSRGDRDHDQDRNYGGRGSRSGQGGYYGAGDTSPYGMSQGYGHMGEGVGEGRYGGSYLHDRPDYARDEIGRRYRGAEREDDQRHGRRDDRERSRSAWGRDDDRDRNR